MLSSVAIFNIKGEVLVSRFFRNDATAAACDVFRIHVVANTDVRSPITQVAKTTFFHIRHADVYIVAMALNNPNAALVFEFLHSIVRLACSYFTKLNEAAVKANFTLIYELFDGTTHITEKFAILDFHRLLSLTPSNYSSPQKQSLAKRM